MEIPETNLQIVDWHGLIESTHLRILPVRKRGSSDFTHGGGSTGGSNVFKVPRGVILKKKIAPLYLRQTLSFKYANIQAQKYVDIKIGA